MKKISDTDYACLVGLKMLSKQADRELIRMTKMAAKIVGEELDETGYGHAHDFIYSDVPMEGFLRKVGVEVEES